MTQQVVNKQTEEGKKKRTRMKRSGGKKVSQRIHYYYNSRLSEKEIENGYSLTQRRYFEIINRFNEEIVNLMIYKKRVVRLPGGIGSMYIIRKKHKTAFVNGEVYGHSIDYPSTKEVWRRYPELTGKKFVYFLNEHSDRYYFKIIYDKKFSTVKNMSLFCFKRMQIIGNKLKEAIVNKDVTIDYYEG